MDMLYELIRILNDSDKRDFKLYMQRKNKRNDSKNIRLFELLETDDIIRINKLYAGGRNKDAYHALRKRLYDNLLLFLSQRTFENANSETYDTLRLIVVARFLFENDLAKPAFKCLERAQRLAKSLEQYTLLHEIFLLRLQYVHLEESVDLEELTKQFLGNQQRLQADAKLQVVYAFLRRELQEVHLKGKIVDLTALIIKTIRQHKVAVSDLMTYKSLYQILFIANEYAAIQQNYGLIEKYVRRSHAFIQRQSGSLHVGTNLFYHLYILYFLANFYLRSRAFAESLQHLRDMALLMDTEKRYKSQFFSRQQLLLALNFHFKGETDEGVQIIREALSQVTKSTKSEDIEDLRITLVLFLAQQGARESLKWLALLTHADAWYEKKLGMLWTIRKSLMEVLVQAQFKNIDVAVARMTNFKKRYKKYLLSIKESRVLRFVGLVERYLGHPECIKEQAYRQELYGLLEDVENKDIFNLSFIAWLIALCEQKTSYEVVLTLLEADR